MTNPFADENDLKNNFPSVVRLNVGGMHFTTRLSTLRKHDGSVLAAMFSGRHIAEKDEDGRFFIDRDGTYFIHILNYLRDEVLPPPEVVTLVYDEAQYYGLLHLMECLRNSPCMFGEIARQTFMAQFPEYDENVDKIINSAKEKALHSATRSHTYELVIAIKFCKHSPDNSSGQNFDQNHVCHTTDGQGRNYRKAEVVFGPWEAQVSQIDSLLQCVILDLTKHGLTVKPSGLRSLCRYYVRRGQKVESCEAQLLGIEFQWW
ncbi:BTB/POZ domain-containing protein KCTD7-like [Ptychodera flava]|uniref:BTB/POZ domain-containing protein KCTD7-like n=1 Tax=Ptychodera flava TaxID=63121 RepID=UPI00396A21D5